MIKVEENKYKFIELLRKVNREGADIPGLIYKLEHSDFFEAPCSTVYHLCVKGGLCQHSLNVYNELAALVRHYNMEDRFSEESIIIVALLHDLSKMNYYELTAKNTKVYCDNGTKRDELGKFEWKSELGYRRKDELDRFVYGHHGQNSEYMTSTFIPLKLEESVAIVNHMGGDDEYKPFDLTPIYNRYTLAGLLHAADFLSTFVVEAQNLYLDEMDNDE